MRLQDISISAKIAGLIASGVTVLAVAIGFSGYDRASNLADSMINDKLTAVVQAKHEALSDYLTAIEQDLRVVASNLSTQEATERLTQAWKQIDGDPTALLQQAYIAENPYPDGQRDQLVSGQSSPVYDLLHAMFHPWFRKLAQERGYYDIFLFDTEGDLLYTVFKEDDFATNLIDGKWRDSDLGRVFRETIAAQPGSVRFFDFSPYEPSNGAPAAFVATQVANAQGEVLGVLAFQMPIDRIDAVMTAGEELGETGDVLIVGRDKLLRNQSSRVEEQTILAASAEGEAVEAALAGGSGVAPSVGLTGRSVLAAYAPLEFKGTTWAILAQQGEEEVFAPVHQMRTLMIAIAVGALVLILGAALFFSKRQIIRPIEQVTGVMKRLAEGDKTVEVPGVGRKDEIGTIGRAVQVFKEAMIESERLQAEQLREQEERAARGRRLEELTANFDAAVSQMLQGVAGAAEEMQATAQSMSSIAEETRVQTTSASSASTQASANVQTVASAAEELSSSIHEIAKQVEQAGGISTRAVGQAGETRETVQQLAKAVERIGEVVNLISDIAEQTNLLALNATIEAARAGEAGKGFAVVASEVKSLATQTAKATEDISQQIAEVQGATGGAVDAIELIAKTVEELNGIASSISAAVEEQTAATGEIARNVQEAATGTSEVTQTLSGVDQGADETSRAASQVLAAVDELTRQTDSLRGEVDGFLEGVKTG